MFSSEFSFFFRSKFTQHSALFRNIFPAKSNIDPKTVYFRRNQALNEICQSAAIFVWSYWFILICPTFVSFVWVSVFYWCNKIEQNRKMWYERAKNGNAAGTVDGGGEMASIQMICWHLSYIRSGARKLLDGGRGKTIRARLQQTMSIYNFFSLAIMTTGKIFSFFIGSRANLF